MTSDAFKKEEYISLCEEIRKHNRLYYLEHSPEISDYEFDLLLKSLEKMEVANPEWVTSDSPSRMVGEMPTAGFRSVKHRIPMLSLANTYNPEEIEDFIGRVKKNLHKENLLFSCEAKMDGIAISVRYEHGLPVRGVTRGDGSKGDDITANIMTISGLPPKLHGSSLPEYLEVRGEVFMTHEVFLALNRDREAKEESLLANPRNAAAGSLKLLDAKEVAKRNLSLFFYGIAEESGENIQSQTEAFNTLSRLGLPVIEYRKQCRTLEEIMAFIEEIRKVRANLPYDIDGVVIKLDNVNEQKKLGFTGKSPRWAVAYKFAAEQAVSRINKITIQVGRTGVLTPVAELDPVFVAGSTISRATLHNEEEIKRKDIRVGDVVIIEKGGDVIPKVVSVDLSKRPDISTPWIMPDYCPCCGSEIERTEGEVAVRCPNIAGCPDQLLRRISYFVAKSAMDIENLGVKIVDKLIVNGYVKKPSDIYKLTEEQLATLEGFKEKSIKNLLSSIEKSKTLPFARFIMALGIKYVGAGTAELLAARSGDIVTLSKMPYEELLAIQGIGTKVAQAVTEFFALPENLEEIDRLLVSGVNPQSVQVVKYDEHLFFGKIFVLTGSMEKYTRLQAATFIKERGGKVAGSVSKKTDYLLAGEEAGSKLDKAKELGIRILTEQEFDVML